MSTEAKCSICGEPMPPGEEMFKYHGYSGNCPKPPLPRPPTDKQMLDWLQEQAETGCVTMCFEIDGGVHVALDMAEEEQRAAREVNSIRDGIAQLMVTNVQIEPTARLFAQVGSNAGLGVAVPPAPTFENGKD